VRTIEEWEAHPQHDAVRALGRVSVTKVGESEPEPVGDGSRPLGGVRALDLTRVLAGPACGKVLAAHGADVLLVNSPILPNAGPFVLAQWGTLDFKDKADIVLRPKGPAPRFHRWYTDAYTLWTGSKVKDAAWEFMAYAGTEGQKDVELAGGRSIPGYKPVAETVFLQTKSLNINKQRWLDAAKEAKQQPLVKAWDEMNAIVSKYRNDLLDQKIAAREAAQGIEREVNTLLSQ